MEGRCSRGPIGGEAASNTYPKDGNPFLEILLQAKKNNHQKEIKDLPVRGLGGISQKATQKG